MTRGMNNDGGLGARRTRRSRVRFVCWRMACILLTIQGLQAQPQWEDVNPLPGHGLSFISPQIAPGGGMWACVAEDSGFSLFPRYVPYLSMDNGNHWELRSGDLPATISVIQIDPNPADPNWLIASTRSRAGMPVPYFSSDGGAHWRPLSAGLTSPWEISSCYGEWFQDGQHLYCWLRSWENPMLLFCSVGVDSQWVYKRESYFYTPGGTHPDGGGLCVLTGTVGYSWQTYDYGQTWHAVDSEPTGYADVQLGGYGPRPGTFYATLHHLQIDTSRTVPMVTYDTCRTWQYLHGNDAQRWDSTGIQEDARIVNDPTDTTHYLYMLEDTVFETRDHGESWQTLFWVPGIWNRFGRIGYNAEEDIVFVMSYMFWAGYVPAIWRLDRGQVIKQPPALPMPRDFLVIYPNPVSTGEQISIVLLAAVMGRLQMVDMLGRRVADVPLAAAPGNSNRTIQLSIPAGLPAGCYFLIVRSTELTRGQRLVIHR